MNEGLGYIFEEQKKSAAVTEADYIGEDGLLYCAKCHTPKQQRFDEEKWNLLKSITGDFPRITWRQCDCEAEREQREKAEKDEAERKAKIEDARESCFPDVQLRTWRFQNAREIGDREAMQKARTYADKFSQALEHNLGMTFWGNVGTGKTYLAACIANSVIEQGFSCLMTSFPRIIDGAWDEQKREAYFESFTLYDLLVIDDLGVERKTGYVNETVTKVIDRRCNSGKPVIVTTNLTPAHMVDKSNDLSDRRVYSRLFTMARPIEVKGSDLRETIGAEKIRKSMEIFGF